MSQPFRFLHASDFHLERPIAGLAELPAHLTELLIDAPYAAAERVFELAISERVDFVVLAGDIVDIARAGPRAVEFLQDRFERLAARQIAVYWAGGAAERRGPWPDGLTLPANVHLFATGAPQSIAHQADGDVLAAVVGRSASRTGEKVAAESFAKAKGGLFTIGVAHGSLGEVRGGKSAVDYWALGGEHSRRRLTGRHHAYHSGSPQGRSPRERGRHGALLTAVDEQGVARTRFVATDVARFRRIGVRVDASATAQERQRTLSQRVETERARAPGLDLFLQIQIRTSATSEATQSRESQAAELLRWLRQEFGTDSPAVWAVSVAVAVSGESAPREPGEGSLLAEFLAALDEVRAESSELPLLQTLSDEQRHAQIASLVRVTDAGRRRQVLLDAERLARQLLAGEAPA